MCAAINMAASLVEEDLQLDAVSELLEFLDQEGLFEFDPTDEGDIPDDQILEETKINKKDHFLRTNVTERSLMSLLERLSDSESNIENESFVAESIRKVYSSNSFEELFKGLLEAVADMFVQCYEPKSSKKNEHLRAIEIERKFYEERTKCSSVNNAWMNILSSADLVHTEATDMVLQHILQHFWSTVGSTATIETSTPITSVKKPDVMESSAIKDHAGWAIKRARDKVKSSSKNQLKIKQSSTDDTILEVDKQQALDLLSKLGKDEKLDGRYRFIPNDDICDFFILLHDVVENLLSKSRIYSEGNKVVIHCLQGLATDRKIRQEWSFLVHKYGFSKHINIFILEKNCTMFVKSKQQIIREKFALKPRKGSSALREELKGKMGKSTKSVLQESEGKADSSKKSNTTPQMILELRRNFDDPVKVSQHLCEISKLPNSKELLSCLTGKELTKILLSLGRPGLDGKKKSRQIDVLLMGNLEVKFPEKLKATTQP